jgi:hypothetical protein
MALFAKEHNDDRYDTKKVEIAAQVPVLERYIDADKQTLQKHLGDVHVQDPGDETTDQVSEHLTKKRNVGKEGIPTHLVELMTNFGLPAPGGYNQAEIQLNVPVPTPTGLVLIGCRFTNEYNRDDNGKLTVMRTTFSITAGYHVPFFTIKGSIGGFVEVKAPTPKMIAELFSYGLYQRMRQSVFVPERMVNCMFGKSTGKSGWSAAEQWAAGVEKRAFGDKEHGEDHPNAYEAAESYVESGSLVEALMDAGLGGATAKATAGYQEGRRIDRDSLKEKGIGKVRNLNDRKEARVATIGRSNRNFVVSEEFEAAACTTSWDLNVAFQGSAERDGSPKTRAVDLGVSFVWKTAFKGAVGAIIQGVSTGSAVLGSAVAAHRERLDGTGEEAKKNPSSTTNKLVSVLQELPAMVNSIQGIDTGSNEEFFESFVAPATVPDQPKVAPGKVYSTADNDFDAGSRGGDTQGSEGKKGLRLNLQIGVIPDVKVDGALFLMDTSEYVVRSATGTEASLFKLAMEKGRKLALVKWPSLNADDKAIRKLMIAESLTGQTLKDDNLYGFEKINEDD